MKEVDTILRIITETKSSVESGDSHVLKKLSEQTIHSATISQDPDNIIVAVLVYSLSKVYSRDNYQRMEGWDQFRDSTIKNLSLVMRYLENNDLEHARAHLGKIRNSLNKISGDLGMYIKDIFRKAEINKAFKLYEHGLSSEQTAKLLGISLWDLASYIGQSQIHERSGAIGIPVEKRLKLAEEFFA